MSRGESQSDELVSLSERKFILEAIGNEQRIDGRGLYDVRSLRIAFGSTWGRVQVQLGSTRCVLAFWSEPISDYDVVECV